MRSTPRIAVLLVLSWAASAQAQDEDEDDVPGGPQMSAKAKRVPADTRPFRVGVSNEFWVGFGGELKNPSPAYDLAADLSFPTGRAMRYHFQIAYRDLNTYNGLRFSPLTLGYEIPIEQRFLPAGAGFNIEILFNVVQAEVLFNEGYSIALSSGLRFSLMLTYDIAFFSLTPLGFELRYAYGVQDIGIRTGIGANWPIHLAVGVEL